MTEEEKDLLMRRMDKMDANLSRVLFILETDQKTNALGLVEQVHTLRKEVDAINVKDQVWKGRIATYAAVGTFLGWAFGWLFKLFVMDK